MKKFGFTRAENQHKPVVSLASRRISHSLKDLHFYLNVRNVFHLTGAIPSLTLKAIRLDSAHLQNSWVLGVRRTRGTKSIQTYPCIVSLLEVCSLHSGQSKFHSFY